MFGELFVASITTSANKSSRVKDAILPDRDTIRLPVDLSVHGRKQRSGGFSWAALFRPWLHFTELCANPE
jgi:hypothetical protein